MMTVAEKLNKRIADLESRLWGRYEGEVTDVNDPEGLNRIKVRIREVFNDTIEVWARVLTPFGGDDAGFSMLPEIGDIVAIEFRGGSRNLPEWTGFYYLEGVRPPSETSPSRRVLKTRSGNILIFDDTSGSEEVILRDKAGNEVEIKADGNIVIKAATKVHINTDNIDIGDIVTESALMGNTTKLWVDTHIHSTPVGPSGPPIVILPTAALSNKVKLKR